MWEMLEMCWQEHLQWSRAREPDHFLSRVKRVIFVRKRWSTERLFQMPSVALTFHPTLPFIRRVLATQNNLHMLDPFLRKLSLRYRAASLHHWPHQKHQRCSIQFKDLEITTLQTVIPRSCTFSQAVQRRVNHTYWWSAFPYQVTETLRRVLCVSHCQLAREPKNRDLAT